ncbi:ATP-binding cassette domain-containing protein [Acidiferrimicrobium sp. IK]|uniref:ABC transporter ATP-binding protein n=1 Tax=Acidiferrimicrobium sp. IK TaxID=2871700 RepID=UPI0021CB5CA7|nr:ATP-binding cassette domain-containing protein [Acidiferrimicrobium sp. IK]MCU4183065.1 ATP-binding cassette domain-containing protein [Acidiferrimicrobium sp. IK]
MIEVRNLTKRYGTTVAVDDLSFSVPAGRVTGFLGPNGAGKSTTMRMILGLDAPASGSATIAGRTYHDLPAPLYEVGALLDAKAMHGGRSAANHLKVLAQSNGIPASRVKEVLAMVGLDAVARRRTKGFSLGMGQRLGIAGALLGDPGVLLFDEPVNGLDPEGILWVRNMMKSLAAEGRTVLVSSHLMNEMAVTADYLVVIGRGKLISEGSVSDFIERSGHRSVLVRSPDLDRLKQLVMAAGASVRPTPDRPGLEVANMDSATIGQIAAANGVVLHELTPRQASLEEAFMELTADSVEYAATTTGRPR